MKLLNNLDRYLTDYEYKIIIKNKYINIINYEDILDFNSNEIRVKNSNGVTRVLGTDLVISKMLDNELVIVGNIEKLEL